MNAEARSALTVGNDMKAFFFYLNCMFLGAFSMMAYYTGESHQWVRFAACLILMASSVFGIVRNRSFF